MLSPFDGSGVAGMPQSQVLSRRQASAWGEVPQLTGAKQASVAREGAKQGLQSAMLTEGEC